MLYFLNLPRVGGTSMYKMSQDVLTFKSNVMNGNWMNDTNTNPSQVSFPIPANDDASKSIECILSIVSKAIAEGLAERDADQDKKAEEKKEKAKQIAAGLEQIAPDQDKKSDDEKGKEKKRIEKK